MFSLVHLLEHDDVIPQIATLYQQAKCPQTGKQSHEHTVLAVHVVIQWMNTYKLTVISRFCLAVASIPLGFTLPLILLQLIFLTSLLLKCLPKSTVKIGSPGNSWSSCSFTNPASSSAKTPRSSIGSGYGHLRNGIAVGHSLPPLLPCPRKTVRMRFLRRRKTKTWCAIVLTYHPLITLIRHLSSKSRPGSTTGVAGQGRFVVI